MTLILDVEPGCCAINQRFAGNNRGGLRLSDSYRAAVDLMALQVRQARLPKIDSGDVVVTIRVYWPRIYTGTQRAYGDIDSPVKAVLDALQKGGAVDNDGRVVELYVSKHVDKLRPRIEVEIRAVME